MIPKYIIFAFILGGGALGASIACADISHQEVADTPAAFLWYKDKADHGDIDAQFSLGVMSETGWSVPVNNKTAVRWYREAAQQGHDEAQLRLGMLYYLGIGARQSDIKGKKWIRKSAKQGNVEAQLFHEKIFGSAVPESLQPKKVLRQVRLAYLVNKKQAVSTLTRLLNESVRKDTLKSQKKEATTIRERRALKVVIGPKATSRSPKPQIERIDSQLPEFMGIATLDENRRLVRGNIATIRMQAKKGLASAQFSLGRMRELGIQVSVDKVKALHWYRQSAKQGFMDAQYRFGIALLYGIGVERDEILGKKWLVKAANQKHPVAKNLVKDNLGERNNINQHVSLAVSWYLEKAMDGNAQSAMSLSKIYKNGWGVVQNQKEAERWNQKAIKMGFVAAPM